MTAEEFREARKALGFSQDILAEHLGLSRMAVNRYENGERTPPPEVVTALAEMAGNVTGPAKSVTGLDVSKLTPWTVPNIPPRDWFPLDETKWQRVGHRVVTAKIPDPIPYDAPAWAGHKAILTKSGRVFDYETGAEIKPLSFGPRPDGPAPGSRMID